MPRVLACRILAKELRYLRPSLNPDYFEPLCHKLQPSKFAAYVDSCVRDHCLLVCGDCGGLAEVAKRRRISILPAKDCIDLLVGKPEAVTLYLTDGWLENLDRIFGLEGLNSRLLKKTLEAMLSTVRKVVYVSTPAANACESKARRLAILLGREFARIEGRLDLLSRGLAEVGA